MAGSGTGNEILYANPGTEGFYPSLGFLPMTTAMAVWGNQERAIELGLLRTNTGPTVDNS